MKKSNRKKTHVHYLFVLDESGSMQSVKDATIEGLNEQVRTLKETSEKFEDQVYHVNFVKFNNSHRYILKDKGISDLVAITEKEYSPSGGTALYKTLVESIKDLKATVKDDELVVVVIMTDGEENASGPSYPSDYVKLLIEERQKTEKWTFAYVGANQDAILAGNDIGINTRNISSYTSDVKGTKNVFRKMSQSLESYACNVSSVMADSTLNDVQKFSKMSNTSYFVPDEEVKPEKDK